MGINFSGVLPLEGRTVWRVVFVPGNLILGSSVALLFLILGWLGLRKAGSETAMRPMKRRLLLYGISLLLGEAYLMVLFADLRWPPVLLVVAMASWAVLLGGGLWYRSQGRKGGLDVVGK